MDDTFMPRKWQHPPSFYCPISQQCMHDPVVLSDGHTYERQHIERWLEQHNTSPVSGLQLPQKGLFPNHALRNAIEEYFQEVFSVHRQAIRKATKTGQSPQQFSGSNDSLLRTVDALVQCSLLMNADLSTECVLRRIMNEAKALVGAEVASVFLVDAERQELYSTVNSTKGELRIPITAGIAGHVATTGEPVVIKDAYDDNRFNKIVDLKTGFKTRNMMCVPLKVKKGAVIGVVQLINKVSDAMAPTASGSLRGAPEEQSFTEDDIHFLEVFASQAATAVASSWIDPVQAGLEDKHEGQQELGGAEEKGAGQGMNAEPQQTRGGAPEVEMSSAEVGSSCVEVGKDGHADHAEHTDQSRILGAHVAHLLAESLNSWQLDTLALADATNNRPLSTLGVYLFDKLGLAKHYGLDQEKLSNFFVEIERGYDDNAYHNRSHAAAVMHAMYALLEHGGIGSVCAMALREGDAPSDESCQLGVMACLLAAAVHDYEHHGLTNDFLVKTSDARALLYNDQHVNEHHHVAAAFAVLQRTECNFLANLPASEYRRLRSLIIDLVLGTDMVNHGNLVKSFSEELDTSTASSGPLSSKSAVLLLQIAMKCSDLGHLALDWPLHLEWVRRLESEFFAQGDQEKHLGLPVSFLMDREKLGVSKSQIGFFDFVVLPLFRALARAAPAASDMLFGVTDNYQRWRDLETSGVDGGDAAGKRAAEKRALRSQSSLTVSSAADEISTSTVHFGEEISTSVKKRSGRARQRAAKWWGSVRQRTPSPSTLR